MSITHETYDIDCFGDILLVPISGDSRSDYEEREETLPESDTLLDDASYLDSSITDGVLAHASESKRDIGHHIARRAVRFQVTSYRLRRSSPVFEQLLNQYVGYPGAAYQLHYPIRIPIWDDDPFIIDLILRVIQADDPFQLPDQDISQLFPNTECLLNHINPDKLARIATVAHKYQLQSTLDSCLVKWVDDTWKHMDGASVSEAMAWIWVTWTFELTDHFSTATKFVARNSFKHPGIEDEIKYPYLH